MPEVITARFPQRLNGALMQLKVMPEWMWPVAMYDLVWPVLKWELATNTEEDSHDLIDAVSRTKDAAAAVWLLCDYMEKKLAEARDG